MEPPITIIIREAQNPSLAFFSQGYCHWLCSPLGKPGRLWARMTSFLPEYSSSQERNITANAFYLDRHHNPAHVFEDPRTSDAAEQPKPTKLDRCLCVAVPIFGAAETQPRCGAKKNFGYGIQEIGSFVG